MIGGGGFFGSILTILLSTFGGGLKLFFPIFIKCSTFESNYTFTDNLQYKSLSFLATNLNANSLWNIRTALLNNGLCDNNLKTMAEDI